MPMAPCPGDGGKSSSGSSSVMLSANPSRRSPAAAKTTASNPLFNFASLGGTFPRIGTTVRSGRNAFNWAIRLGDPVPTRAPRRSPASVEPHSASWRSSRGGVTASAKPSGIAVGRSLRLCTAMSILPSSSSCASWLENAPLPVPLAPLTSRSELVRSRSPSVITTRFLNFTTGHGPPNRARNSATIACARRLPRAPTTTVSIAEGYSVPPHDLSGFPLTKQQTPPLIRVLGTDCCDEGSDSSSLYPERG